MYRLHWRDTRAGDKKKIGVGGSDVLIQVRLDSLYKGSGIMDEKEVKNCTDFQDVESTGLGKISNL